MDTTYIFMAVHTEGFDLLDRLDIVIVGLRRAIGGGSDLVDLLADGPEVVGRSDGLGTVRLWLIVRRRHCEIE